LIFFYGADLEDREADDVALQVNFLHHSVVGGLAEEAFFFLKENFEEVAFGVEPNSYFFGHSITRISWRAGLNPPSKEEIVNLEQTPNPDNLEYDYPLQLQQNSVPYKQVFSLNRLDS